MNSKNIHQLSPRHNVEKGPRNAECPRPNEIAFTALLSTDYEDHAQDYGMCEACNRPSRRIAEG